MQQLTSAGNDAVRNLAQRYGVSSDAVTTLLFAVSNGGGNMAQFYHHELGGGRAVDARAAMTMVGDMFNHGLQALVSNLCSSFLICSVHNSVRAGSAILARRRRLCRQQLVAG